MCSPGELTPSEREIAAGNGEITPPACGTVRDITPWACDITGLDLVQLATLIVVMSQPTRSLPPVRWFVWCAVFAAIVTGVSSLVELSEKSCAPITMTDPESPWIATGSSENGPFLQMTATSFPDTHC